VISCQNAIVENVDAIVIINYKTAIDKLFFYFTPIRSGVFENSAVIVTPNEKILLTSKLEFETAQNELKDVQCYHYESIYDLLPTIAVFLKGYRNVGLNFEKIPYAAYSRLKKLVTRHSTSIAFKDLSAELVNARLIKTNEELEKIKKACDITTQVANEIPSYDHPNEKTVAAHIEFNMRKRGATSPAFSTISAIGPNSADPHYTTGDRPTKSGDYLLTDFGAEYARYNADLTRTFIFDKANPKAKKIYELVLQAQLDAMDAIHAGVVAKDIDAIARNLIEKYYPGRFIHSLGHSLGLEVHDGGSISRHSDLVLEPGMVFTVEPGVYLRDYGGVRIEDDIIVTKNGFIPLTPAKKEELIEIPI